MKRSVMHVFILVVLLLATTAMASPPEPGETEPYLNGSCVSLGQGIDGMWQYRLNLSWDTGKHGLSHVDVILDDSGNCTPENMLEGLNFASPAGSGLGEPAACVVEYRAMVEAADPSIDLVAVVLKYEPRSAGGCEPGARSEARFNFSSPYPPASIAEENLFLVQKFSNASSFGTLVGEFPGLPCNPVTNETVSWTAVKTMYGR